MSALPSGFVYLDQMDSTIKADLKYLGSDNFVGRPINGYEQNCVILTKEAAEATLKASQDLNQKGYGLIIYDAYRPQSACDHFWQWANDEKDIINKEKFYPTFTDKKELFNGFIARYSKHSRGSAVDLGLYNLATQEVLDMGAIFDFFGEISYTDSPLISEEAKKNRLLLKQAMEKHGFQNYHKEWWHYELINEPFTRKPEDHFNFPVR